MGHIDSNVTLWEDRQSVGQEARRNVIRDKILVDFTCSTTKDNNWISTFKTSYFVNFYIDRNVGRSK